MRMTIRSPSIWSKSGNPKLEQRRQELCPFCALLLLIGLVVSSYPSGLFCVTVCAAANFSLARSYSRLFQRSPLGENFLREIVLSHCENVQTLVTHILFFSSLKSGFSRRRVCWRQHAVVACMPLLSLFFATVNYSPTRIEAAWATFISNQHMALSAIFHWKNSLKRSYKFADCCNILYSIFF